MISYFKYDSKNAFTLDGAPYDGFFHVLSGVAYAGKSHGINPIKLTPNSNFLSECYLNYAVFDGTMPVLDLAVPNALDIFDETTIKRLIERVNQNNLKIYQHAIYLNPNLLPYDYKNTFFYTLSSTEADIRTPDDVIYGKNVYTHSDPFSYSSEWEFLDRVESGAFLIDNTDAFVYYCIADGTTYALTGKFRDPSTKLTLVSQTSQISTSEDFNDVSITSNNLKIEASYETDEIFFYKPDKLLIFDFSKYENCNKLFLLDSVPITANKQTIKFFKIGNSKRTEFVNEFLYIKNKYSNELLFGINIRDFGLTELIALDIRKEDDNILIIGKNQNKTYVVFFDSDDYENTLRIEELLYVDDYVISDVSFSKHDSDFFEIFKKSLSLSSVGKMRLSSDIRSIKNINLKLLKINPAHFFYIDDYIINETTEHINKIQIKFNSNKMESNTFNNLTYNLIQKNGYLYYILHNIGRIYVSKTKSTLYKELIDRNLAKTNSDISCGSSSVGLSFNTSLINVLKDLVNLGTAMQKIKSSRSNLNDTFDELIPTPTLKYIFENLLMNGNESINVASLQRIFVLINNLQKQLIGIS